jgi:hypothetical protein
VRSLMVPIFLYSDVVYFPSLTGAEFRRLELVFNACTSYVYTVFGVLIIFFRGEFKVYIVRISETSIGWFYS